METAENISSNDSMCKYPDIYTTSIGQSTIAMIVFSIVMLAICVVAIAGNTLVLLAFVKITKLRRTRNMFICNLSITDLITGFAICTRTIIGEAASDALNISLVAISWLTILGIAVDRFIIIVAAPNTYEQIVTPRGILITCVCFWIVPLSVTLPFSNDTDNVTLILFNVLPSLTMTVLSFIIILYAIILYKIRRHEKRLRDIKSNRQFRETRAVAKAFTLILGVAVIVTVPWAIEAFRISLKKRRSGQPCYYTSETFFIFSIIGLTNAAVNPFIYWRKMPGFKSGIRSLFRGCCKKDPGAASSHLSSITTNKKDEKVINDTAHSPPGTVSQSCPDSSV
ncbi:histamine H2 receptor-like [Anneissia japonica]|uniref:histamine H2 receptor-like n=1 Tax=Anneissia japonica TaxID=1529436 RepID=UPI0014259E2D|nr:histamine H2 receptor-like [Anneissia japonica]